MKRRSWGLAAGLMGILVAGAWFIIKQQLGSGDADDARRPLICAIDAEGGAPYIFIDPQHPDSYIGFEADLTRSLAVELHRPIEFKQYEFSSIFSGLARDDFDLSISGLEITPDRLERFHF